MIAPEIVRRLRGSREWAAVEKHITDTIASLDAVTDIQGDAEAIALEVKGRQNAVAKLTDILRPFVEFQDRTSNQAAEELAADTGLDHE